MDLFAKLRPWAKENEVGGHLASNCLTKSIGVVLTNTVGCDQGRRTHNVRVVLQEDETEQVG